MKVIKGIAFVMLIGFMLAGCENYSTSIKNLSGTVTITPNTGVTTGTKLTAAYNGPETVILFFQWSKDRVALAGANEPTYTPTTAGSYAVTVSAARYHSKTSAEVVVTDPAHNPAFGDPSAEDYTITGIGTFTYDGDHKIVTVVHKDGKSPGAVTVHYNGSTMAPVNAGTYAVTFNVSGAAGWNEASDLSAGSLIITKAAGAALTAPTEAAKTTNSVTLNTVTASTNQTVEYGINAGNSSAGVTWQDNSTTFNGLNPGTTYYFFARAKENNNYNTGAASGGTPITTVFANLSGTISIIIPHPNVEINTELEASYSGSENVSYQWHKDGADINGATFKTYTPLEGGEYTVTVYVMGYNHKTSSPVMVIDPNLPYLSGNITITPDTGVTTGMELEAVYSGPETVSYRWHKDGDVVGNNSNKYTPLEAGEYIVTVYATGYNPKESYPVTVINRTPDSFDYIIGERIFTYDGNPKPVTIEAESGKSPGAVIVYYEGADDITYYEKKPAAPVNAGTYAVTFNVSEATGWDEASDMDGGTLRINKAAGATVNAPEEAFATMTSVTLKAIPTTSTNQAVEYGMTADNTVPDEWQWQNNVVFDDLIAGKVYYFFTRAKENENYHAGAASASTEITTKQQMEITIFNYWVDDIGNIVIGRQDGSPVANITVEAGGSITFTTDDSSYTGQIWTLNGINTGETGSTYTFDTAGKVRGRDYIVGLRVQKENNFYLTRITVKVGN